MTIEDFIARIPKGGWLLLDGQYIRRSDIEHCPLAEVAGTNNGYVAICIKLGLSTPQIESITDAADRSPFGYSRQLRTKLLTACGLEEQ